MVQTIHLPRKKIKRFKLGDKTLILTLDARTIHHFQSANKKGFLKLIKEFQVAQEMEEAPAYEMIQLLGSCVQYQTGQPVGVKFFKDYDELRVIELLMPMLTELYDGNLPKANGENEKK